ncbi:MAG: hypothetical protein ACNA7W_10650 [Pseudomonadales bacterium]
MKTALIHLLLGAMVAGGSIATAVADDDRRTADGRPDFSGTYNVATLTPLQRPAALGETLILSPEEARRIAAEERRLLAEGLEPSDPNRSAPPRGGDGSTGAAGNVGGYNTFWIDRGDGAIMIDGNYRTSIMTSPGNGRFPGLVPEAQKVMMERRRLFRENTGEAWWLEHEGPGPYDDPELRPLGERCLLGFGSTAGPPMLPVLYNNIKRIIQTPDTVVIVTEMNHDARIVRMNAKHAPPDQRFWLGDSIGWWEGDTLVIDTTNFRDQTGLSGGTRDLHVEERFRRATDGTLLYSFTVRDPNVWVEPWSGEYPWPETDDLMFEYACHEGNYALGGILRGARLLEAEARQTAAEAEGRGAP